MPSAPGRSGLDRPTTGFRRLCRWAGVIGAVVAFAGCGTSPPTRFYTLAPIGPSTGAAVVSLASPPLQVRAVHVPPAWDRIELLREIAPGQVQVREFDQWAAPLGRSARQALTEDLATRLPAGAVLFPQAARGSDASNGTDLTVDILSLRVDGRRASMQVAWASRSLPTAAWRRTLPATLEVPVTSDDGDATAQALSGLLARLADLIVADLIAPAPAPAPTSASAPA